MYAENPKAHPGYCPENAASPELMEVWPRYFPGETELSGRDRRAILVGALVNVLEERSKLLPRVSAGLHFPYIAPFPSPLTAMRFCF
jgi:hypothetical protein